MASYQILYWHDIPAQVIEVAELVPADLRAVLFAAVGEELAP